MIEVTYFYGVHQGGTKDYHLYLFHSAATGNYLLVKRWGKVGTDGQVKVESVGSNGKKSFNKALNERTSSGYDMRHETKPSRSYGNVADALTVLPLKHRNSFYENQLAQLDPAAYDRASRDTHDPLKAERDAKFGAAAKEAQEATDAARADAARIEAQQEADELKSNPFFGMF